MKLVPTLKSYKFLWALYGICLFENLVIRLILTIEEFPSLQHPFTDLARIFLLGIYNDTLFFSYFLIPFLLYLWLAPQAVLQSRFHKPFCCTMMFLVIVVFTFQGHAEWFFWQEFHSRFNFIAVDYLVYTQEVIGNIMESYPMIWVYVSILAISLLLYGAVLRWVCPRMTPPAPGFSFKRRTFASLVLIMVSVVSFFNVNTASGVYSDNFIVDQLARNGFYQWVSAFRNNKLDYYSFYKTVPDNEAIQIMHRELSTPENRFTSSSPENPDHLVINPGPEKHYNVIFVLVESLSASFLGTFGNTENLTPNLDQLAKESLVFTQLYATGNRTVRGLEAVMLSLPPTPGYSIVKRPNNEQLFTLGEPFEARGYDLKFLYGGYGYFDNMNYFFGHNDFEVIDRTQFDDSEVGFANIWGISDEYLFQKALKEADKSHASGKPFFEFVLTTSNHRPYTYPEGRIDIPSKTGRKGGVKYTDYAIGKLIEEARRKPWFDNTVFVILADHCAGGRGLTTVPVQNYHIPAIIYAPGKVEPGKVNRVASQIDFGPTLLGLLDFTYKSKFLGKDILKMTPEDERLVLGTYQNLGFYKAGHLIVLSPPRRVIAEKVDLKDYRVQPESNIDEELLKEAISYYQYPSYILKHNLYAAFDVANSGQIVEP